MELRRSVLIFSMSTLILFLAKGQISADFTANVRSGCGSFQVSFTDLSSSSSGPITSWSWDLGGVHSSKQHPGRIYGNPGKYKICLTVTDSQGNTDTECKEDYITVYQLPVPEFVADVQEGCSPLMVNFTDQSRSTDSPIKEWIWGMGGMNGVVLEDGSRPVIPNIYSTPDDYTVSLTVIDENGCLNTLTKNQYITVHKDPQIEFTVDQDFACEAPLEANFSNMAIDSSVQYVWDFGNGETFIGATPPSVIYGLPGTYTLIVRAVNLQTGCKSEKIYEDFIQIGYPVEFSVSAYQGCAPFEVSFSDLSAEAADSVVWDFGNGNTSRLANPIQLYQRQGCFPVSLTRYIDGCPSTYTTPQCIQVDTIAVPDYSLDAPIGCALPHTVNFTSDAPSAVEWHWSFGDGKNSRSEHPSHPYQTFGEFPVRLEVTDQNGCTASILKDTIRLMPLEANMIPEVFKGCTPLDVQLKENSRTIAPISFWDWKVTDGQLPPQIQQSNDAQPQFVLVDTGRYAIQLIVENQLGCRDTSWFNEQIGVGMKPVAGFSADPRASCIGTSFSFTNQSSNYADEWYWEFGDGNISTKRNPKHTYGSVGLFDVSLKASHYKCEDKITFQKYIDVEPPMARFKIERDCERPYEVRLIDQSVGADSLIYDFGVPNTVQDISNLRNPVFIFPETGTYIISQVVFNLNNGCRDSTAQEIIITDPKAQFTLPQLQGCNPLVLQPLDQSEFGIQYNWSAEFGHWKDSLTASPELTIDQPGAYSGIRLTIMDINSCIDTLLFRDTIRVNEVVAGLATQPSGGCRPLTVAFEDQSTSLFSTIDQWEWNFGVGSSPATHSAPVFTYDTTGLFDVSLKVTDEWGCEGEILLSDEVEVTYPIAAFSADTVGCTSNEVHLFNHSQGTDLEYLWNFGDGQTSSEKTPSHQYAAEGIYDICLTVTDKYGCDSTICRKDYIHIINPEAQFSVDTAFASCPPLIVNFQNHSQNAYAFNWTFGDSSGQSTHESPVHVYTIPGTYDITLIASGLGNCRDTFQLEDLIRVEGPVGSFNFEVDSSCVPLSVTFFGSGVEAYDFIWDLGNGQLDSSLQQLNDTLFYEYDEVGTYTPQLILVNDDNCQRVLESPDTVVVTNLDIDFTSIPTVNCGPADLLFLNLTQSAVRIDSFQWLFPQANPAISRAIEPLVSFDSTGSYDVGLIADNGFCRDTLYRPDFIQIGEAISTQISVDQDTVCNTSSIAFAGQLSMGTSQISGWYWDFGDGTKAEGPNQQHYFEEPGTYRVSLRAVSAQGCEDSTTYPVVVLPIPNLEDREYPEICQGDQQLLDVRGSFDTSSIHWQWAYHPDLSCTDCLMPVVQPLEDTRYYLVLENEWACRDTVVFHVNVGPYAKPDIQLSGDTLICLYDSMMIQLSGGLPVYQYQWQTTAAGLSCYDCPQPTAFPSINTWYRLQVTSAEGCTSKDSIYIEVIDQSYPFAGPDRTICAGDSIQLNISDGEHHLWLETAGLSCTLCFDPLAYPTTTRMYPVQMRTTDFGCTLLDTLIINVVQRDEVSAGPDTTLCLGESYIFKARGEGSVQWSPDIGLDRNDILDAEAGPTASTTYVLEVQNGDCLLRDSLRIEVKDKVSLFVQDTAICQGTAATLSVGGDALEYDWQPEVLIDQPGIATPIVFPESTTEYTVIGYNSICEPDTAIIRVMVHPLPKVSIIPRYYFFEGDPVHLLPEVLENQRLQYQWSPPDGLSCVDCPDPIAIVDTTTVYELTVIEEENGCWNTAQTTVKQLFGCPQDLINVPNVFTPNNDGINDVLELHPSKAIGEILKFQVFSRWGELVFETTDIYARWDGRFKGEMLPSGVYVYYLEANCPVTKYNFIKTGDITIMNR